MVYERAVRVVIATGDENQRERVHRIVRSIPSMSIEGVCSSADEARALIAFSHPQILIIDTDLPGGGGFQLLGMGPDRPMVVFTSLSDSDALAAFQFHAVDYLLHPVDAQRLTDALARACVLCNQAAQDAAGDAAIDELRRKLPAAHAARRLMVKSAGKICFLKAEEIDWVEAERDYVRIHNGARKHLLRSTLSGMEQQLPAERFLRIHRSTIVNVDRIREMQPLSYGEYAVILHDGTRLTLSRSFRERVFDRLVSAA